MNTETTQILWDIFMFIRKNWSSSDDMNQDQFNRVLKYKVEINSAYNDYYQAAVNEYNMLLDQTGAKEKALLLLFQNNVFPNPKLPDVANFVLSQFMIMHVAFGGFKTLGYENYRGWMGGGSFELKPPPYRVYNKRGDSE